MMKRMSFWLLGMLLNMLPVMASSADSLTFSNVRTEGVVYAGMPLRVTIEVTNNATEDYYGIWSVGADEIYDEYYKWIEIKNVEIKAGETNDISFETIILKAGDLPLFIYDVTEKRFIYNFSIHAEDAQLNLTTTIQLDLQEDVTDGSRYTYCDYETYVSVKGTVTITNNDEESILTKTLNEVGPKHGLFKYSIIPRIRDFPEEDYFSIEGLPDEIKSGETVTGYINYKIGAQPIADQEYVVEVKYIDTVIATSEPFTFRISTNTYWKSDGTQLPLTVGDDNTLIVPKEATAVDLRGLYYLDTRFKIDVSEANPNCLYYLTFIDYVPKGFTSDANIILEYEANVLSIDSNYDFNGPIPFTAKNAFFTYTPVSESMGPASPVMSQRMSGFIHIPFAAQKAWLAGTNEYHEDSPFYNEDFKVARLWGMDNGTVKFYTVSPDVTLSSLFYYLVYDMKPSPLVFYSENAYININYSNNYREIISSHNEVLLTQVSKKPRKADKYTYSWNCDKNCFLLNEEGATIRPYNVTVGVWDNYTNSIVDTGYDHLFYSIESPGGETAIKSIRRTPEDNAIYSISGQRVGTATYTNGRLCTDGLKPGLYLVGGKKVVVK